MHTLPRTEAPDQETVALLDRILDRAAFAGFTDLPTGSLRPAGTIAAITSHTHAVYLTADGGCHVYQLGDRQHRHTALHVPARAVASLRAVCSGGNSELVGLCHRYTIETI